MTPDDREACNATNPEFKQIIWMHGRAALLAVYEALRVEHCIAQPTPQQRQHMILALGWGLRAH